MISKNKAKYIRSLSLKKNRKAEDVFIAEGPKVVGDILVRSKAKCVVATHEWIASVPGLNAKAEEVIEATEEELCKVSLLQSPQQVMAIFPQQHHEWSETNISDKLVIALDGVQDPGNLGTIIRVADWFGIDTIICSNDTAEAYNPKVVQATMGSIARVNVEYCDLVQVIKALPADYPVFATLLNGDNIYAQKLPTKGMIVMGNEGNGISQEVRRLVSNKLLIPDFASSSDKAESLNVAIATAIVCSEFRRQSFNKMV